jgi:hypothetical protein
VHSSQVQPRCNEMYIHLRLDQTTPTTRKQYTVKTFNYLHLSGLTAAGLLVACAAQQWLGDHRGYTSGQSAFRSSPDTIHAAQIEHEAASAKLAMIREDRIREYKQRNQSAQDIKKREQAWAAFYTVPEICHNPGTSAVFNACADEHIRAKREFDQQYARSANNLEPYRSTVAINE